MTAHNPIAMYRYQIGDVVQIVHVTTERDHGQYEVQHTLRERTTGYNNRVRSPDGLGRIVGGQEPNWEVERDDTLNEADLETTQQALEARAETLRQAVAAHDRLLASQRRPIILKTVDGPVPYLTGHGELTPEDFASQTAQWDADAALVQQVLGVTVAELQAEGRLPN